MQELSFMKPPNLPAPQRLRGLHPPRKGGALNGIIEDRKIIVKQSRTPDAKTLPQIPIEKNANIQKRTGSKKRTDY